MKQTRAFFNRFSIGVTALWLLLFALLPNIGLLVVTVLTRGEQDFVLPQFTLDNYLRLLDPTFLKILWESLWLAFMSTLACLLVGYPFAYRIARASAKMKPWLLLLVIIPFWTNSLIRTYALILILKANGLISTLLVWLGVTEQPVSFMYGDFAVFMGILYTFLPFMVLPLYASIEKLDSRLLDAARDLGASGFQSFWHVTFPLTLARASSRARCSFSCLRSGRSISLKSSAGPKVCSSATSSRTSSWWPATGRSARRRAPF